ncbi:threonine--tRNA ligase [Candidatus Pacearchaeota archaeon]|nr:threonine--tRNA ligase [Candidatus Pacearchaeota archaeon]
MKILALHSDYVKFKPLKKALKSVDELKLKDKAGKLVKEALMVLTAVEKGDEKIKEIVEKFVWNVKDIAKQVQVKNIVLYPYAHLSSNLANPEIALKVLDGAAKILKKSFKVIQAPFGYYKEFEIKVKGHPLSELSREIKVEGSSKGRIKEEEKIDYNTLLKEITKSKLDRRKLKENDHRIIGQQMDLFSFNDVAPGMPFWHNNGLIIYNELIKFIREEIKKQGYAEIRTPEVLDVKLWKVSGHWEKYRENIFLSEYEKRTFATKPMNCPGGLLIFKEKPKSYKDLPLRFAEFGVVHRQELSGVLAGLFRVTEFTQDDAHIFCTEAQLEDEILKIIKLMEKVYDKFKFPFHLEFSTRPEKRIGSDKMWDKAEKSLESVLKKNKINYKLNKGDGAFYGPKIDFHTEDSLGRTWQLGTIQLDFSMPERFDLEYTNEDNKKKMPVMIHRAIFGSLERFIGVLLEHTNGRLPVWLAPIQVRIINFTDRNSEATKKVVSDLEQAVPGLRIDSDFRQTTVNEKIRDAELMRIPHIIVIGDKEEKDRTLAVRERGSKQIKSLSLAGFSKSLKQEIEQRE